MPETKRMTITLPTRVAASVNDAVAGGDYGSSSEVIQEALADWEAQRAVEAAQRAALKQELEKGLADIAAGRVHDFSVDRIVDRGRLLSASR